MRSVVTILCSCLIMCPGCRPEVEERTYRAVTGVATGIDLETGEVSMDWKNAETGTVKRLTGRVTQTTEIMINGVTAPLEEVRVGDRAVVVVYRFLETSADWIVTSVSIERQEGFVLHQDRARNVIPSERSDADR